MPQSQQEMIDLGLPGVDFTSVRSSPMFGAHLIYRLFCVSASAILEVVGTRLKSYIRTTSSNRAMRGSRGMQMGKLSVQVRRGWSGVLLFALSHLGHPAASPLTKLQVRAPVISAVECATLHSWCDLVIFGITTHMGSWSTHNVVVHASVQDSVTNEVYQSNVGLQQGLRLK